MESENKNKIKKKFIFFDIMINNFKVSKSILDNNPLIGIYKDNTLYI